MPVGAWTGSALVTGASRGVGAALVRRLAALGLTVHAVARDAEALARLRGETGCTVHAVDLTDASALARLGELDVEVLVNNAGLIAGLGRLDRIGAEEVDRMIDLNLRVPLQLARLLLPGMVARGGGHVVNVGSLVASSVFPGTAPYAAAKAGLSMAGRVLRYDLAGTGVRVTEVAPGRIETDIYVAAMGGDRDQVRERLFGRHAALKPEDVAEAVMTAVTAPPHVDLSYVEVVPTDQAPGGAVYAERRD
ncbi:SDR family oxidoreductase [Arenibaculum sp.]|uniref:SDR family oxidoreductase n=1 Tax=Arenibaculum sp. TaxID=2865862 RepID=UPI002E123538|nr:SDR family oxidoreductase [Arenibaculum sp.]